ncbi:MAG: hypothetical protein A2173_04705 [Planctomycetes bacterium RBG_13_44_8b]|nr:MAG: hypothetical protein A2173_04705 [Planctomycetes bacterium RBG_13_44_8b]
MMAVLVGIDEAGFGPILGPLVVSSSSFLVPGHFLELDSTGLPAVPPNDSSSSIVGNSGQAGSPHADLWHVLKRSVAKKRTQLSGRLLITDSKKAYSRSIGIKHLQRTVLAVLKCYGKEPATLTELVKLLCPDYLGQLNEYPWHKNAINREIFVDKAEITLASMVFGEDLTSNGVKFLGLRSCCLDVAFYNKMISCMKNKANVLFSVTSQLIKNAFDNYPGEDMHIIIDRQGGRVHYREHLQRMFSEMQLCIIRETPQESIYQLITDGRIMRVHFIVGADENFLPVSLASMVSKYLRELLVDNINCYFLHLCPDIKPTAGYWKDGLRFIKDLQVKAPHVKFNSDQLIRCR